ncbi:kinase-like protein [Auricularia subglabra TFB-10046 SS5]|nr:kinase-like protein [Auricularia subglabra TFB-10046 SS5]
MVAVKTIRNNGDEPSMKRSREHLLQEIATLRLLDHRNILSFRGICIDDHDVRLVTPWADGGNLRQYLRKHPAVDRRSLLHEIAAGMLYLHSKSTAKPFIVVHGDLHITNILMHGTTPLISDFGLSSIIHDQPEKSRSADGGVDPETNMPHGHFTPMVAEVAMGGEQRTTRSDVYSFGMLMFEVYAGHGPFPEAPNGGFSALVRLCDGQRPTRTDIRRGDFTEDLWCLLTECWAHKSATRPLMSDVYSRLA